MRLRQWAFDRQALKAAKTTDYQRVGWRQRNKRTADVRIVRVLIFEQAFSRLSQDDPTILAVTYTATTSTSHAPSPSSDYSTRKVNTFDLRSRLADILNRFDML